jgi:3-oxoadipate enol-lactonase
VLERWFTPAADPAVVERARRMFLATPAEGYARCCEALRDADLHPELARIEAPTFVICGSEDPTVTVADAEAIPATQRFEIGAAAHLPSAERPAEFNAILKGVLG